MYKSLDHSPHAGRAMSRAIGCVIFSTTDFIPPTGEGMRRISLNNFSNEIKKYVHQRLLGETHLMQLLGMSIDGHLSAIPPAWGSA
jgi:hypothetical protein